MANTSTEIYEMRENQGVIYSAIDERIVNAGKKVYIFSVDPQRHIVAKGGRGDFMIPGKPDGKRVSEPLVLNANCPEHIHTGTDHSPVHYTDGMDLAKDIVGTASSDNGLGRYTSNLEWHGVFITYNEKPTKDEIEAAEKKRRQYLEAVVSEADQKYMKGDKVDAFERAAAQSLNLRKVWAEAPTAMDTCPACGSGVRFGIAVCPTCRAILDAEKAKQFFPEMFKEQPKA